MPFLLAEILNFQGSIHLTGVGSFSYLYAIRVCTFKPYLPAGNRDAACALSPQKRKKRITVMLVLYGFERGAESLLIEERIII